MAENDVNEDLLDYEEEEATEAATGDAAKEANGVKTKKVSKFRLVSILPFWNFHGLCISISFGFCCLFLCTNDWLNYAFQEGVKGNYVSIHSSGFR